MVAALDGDKAGHGHAGNGVRCGLAISLALAVFAVVAVLTFGGPF